MSPLLVLRLDIGGPARSATVLPGASSSCAKPPGRLGGGQVYPRCGHGRAAASGSAIPCAGTKPSKRHGSVRESSTCVTIFMAISEGRRGRRYGERRGTGAGGSGLALGHPSRYPRLPRATTPRLPALSRDTPAL